ncbi:hypothetical protein LCGC14_2424860, partial [marine sediment metagenome]
ANPETPVNFNSNEPNQPVEPYYNWVDSLDSYDPSYMSHTYYPDDFSSTWSMNTLNMYNQFPAAIITEDWNSWNLNYNSGYTNSSYNNGQFNSQLNYGNNSKTPDTIQINDGSLVSAGDLNNVGDTYSTYLSTDPIFNYNYYNKINVPLQVNFDNPLAMGMWGTYSENNLKYDDGQFSTIVSESTPIYYNDGTDVPASGEFDPSDIEGTFTYGDLLEVDSGITTIGANYDPYDVSGYKIDPSRWSDFSKTGITVGELLSNDETHMVMGPDSSTGSGSSVYSDPEGNEWNGGWTSALLEPHIDDARRSPTTTGFSGGYITGNANDWAYFDMENVVFPANNYITNIQVYVYLISVRVEPMALPYVKYRFNGYTSWSSAKALGYDWTSYMWKSGSWGQPLNVYGDVHADSLQVRLEINTFSGISEFRVEAMYAKISYAPITMYYHDWQVTWDVTDSYESIDTLVWEYYDMSSGTLTFEIQKWNGASPNGWETLIGSASSKSLSSTYYSSSNQVRVRFVSNSRTSSFNIE